MNSHTITLTKKTKYGLKHKNNLFAKSINFWSVLKFLNLLKTRREVLSPTPICGVDQHQFQRCNLYLFFSAATLLHGPKCFKIFNFVQNVHEPAMTQSYLKILKRLWSTKIWYINSPNLVFAYPQAKQKTKHLKEVWRNETHISLNIIFTSIM